MHAPRRTNRDTIKVPEGRLFMDFLFIGYTLVVAVIIGKFLFTNTAVEIVVYFESEENTLSIALIISCLVFIGLYSTNFFYFRRHEILVDIFKSCLRSGQIAALQYRSNFNWWRNLLAVLQPPAVTRMYIQTMLRYFFRFNLVMHLALLASFWCAGADSELIWKDMTPFALYLIIAFLTEENSFESVLGHTGYIFVHVGIMLAYTTYTEASYIFINIGISSLILCVVWYFVNVPVKKVTKKRKKKN